MSSTQIPSSNILKKSLSGLQVIHHVDQIMKRIEVDHNLIFPLRAKIPPRSLISEALSLGDDLVKNISQKLAYDETISTFDFVK